MNYWVYQWVLNVIIDITPEVVSSTLEKVDIHIEFDPSKDEEEGLASLIATLVDLVAKYDHMNNLVKDE